MQIKIKSYAGKMGFYLRKVCPNICSKAYLFVQRKISDFPNKKYMKLNSERIIPLFVNIETINRCNGFCSFCCCNAKDDVRQLQKMDDKTFKKIIKDLAQIDYDGVITLNINNEPFLDPKMLDRLEYIRKQIPKAYSFLYTNGSVLSLDKLKKIVDNHLLDELTINNYNTKYELNNNIKKLYNHFKDKEIDVKINVNMRYSKEVLSNRANTSPNKTGKKIIKSYCSIPYTDLNIFPNGNVGMCCCDTKEITNLGNVMQNNIIDIFNNTKFKMLRKLMSEGRNKNSFCRFCDFNDIGTRRKHIKNKMKIKDSDLDVTKNKRK